MGTSARAQWPQTTKDGEGEFGIKIWNFETGFGFKILHTELGPQNLNPEA